MVVDLTIAYLAYGSLVGREHGEKARALYGASRLDTALHIHIKVPPEVYAISSSFLQGLLGKTIARWAFAPKSTISIDKGFELTLQDAISTAAQRSKEAHLCHRSICQSLQSACRASTVWLCSLIAVTLCTITSFCVFIAGESLADVLHFENEAAKMLLGCTMVLVWVLSLLAAYAAYSCAAKGEKDAE